MHRWLATVVFVGAGFLLASPAIAQELAPLDAKAARVVASPPGRTLTSPSIAAHGAIVAAFMRGRGLDRATEISLREREERSVGANLAQLRMEQEVDGLRVIARVEATFNGASALVHLVRTLHECHRPASSDHRSAKPGVACGPQELYPSQASARWKRAARTTPPRFPGAVLLCAAVTAIAVPMTDNVLSRIPRHLERRCQPAQPHGGRGMAACCSWNPLNQDSYNVFAEDPEGRADNRQRPGSTTERHWLAGLGAPNDREYQGSNAVPT